MPRKARKISATNIYHVVIKGSDHQILFEEKKDYIKYLHILDYYREECNFSIYAYCLMSNHVHLIIRINEVPLSTIFRKINTSYAGWFNTKYNRTGFLQDGRFFSEPIENEDYLLSAIRYVHLNPTKAGLEESPGKKYRWSSYNDFFANISTMIDTKYVLSFYENISDFRASHSQFPTEDIFDIEKARRHLPDDVAKEIIAEISKCNCSAEFQNLPLKERNKFIYQIHNKGVSIRQINRLTGTPKGVIDRILKKNNMSQSSDTLAP